MSAPWGTLLAALARSGARTTRGGQLEPRPLQRLDDRVGLQPVEVERDGPAECLVQVQGVVTDLEGDQCVAARPEHPVELVDDSRPLGSGHVDE
jgi:hypothetical protein